MTCYVSNKEIKSIYTHFFTWGTLNLKPDSKIRYYHPDTKTRLVFVEQELDKLCCLEYAVKVGIGGIGLGPINGYYPGTGIGTREGGVAAIKGYHPHEQKIEKAAVQGLWEYDTIKYSYDPEDSKIKGDFLYYRYIITKSGEIYLRRWLNLPEDNIPLLRQILNERFAKKKEGNDNGINKDGGTQKKLIKNGANIIEDDTETRKNNSKSANINLLNQNLGTKKSQTSMNEKPRNSSIVRETTTKKKKSLSRGGIERKGISNLSTQASEHEELISLILQTETEIMIRKKQHPTKKNKPESYIDRIVSQFDLNIGGTDDLFAMSRRETELVPALKCVISQSAALEQDGSLHDYEYKFQEIENSKKNG